MNKTVKEFFDFVTMEIEVYHIDEVYPTELYVYNYIKKVTDNFDKISLHYFLKEISTYFDYMPIKFYEDVMFNGKLYKKNETIRFIDLVHIHSQTTGHYNELESILDKYNFIKNNFEEFKADLLGLNVEQALTIYEIAIQKHTTLNKTTPPPAASKSKQPLTFKELFVKPYSENIESLLIQLKNTGLTETDNSWRKWETGLINKSDASKLYFYLKRKNVLDDYDKTLALICFNEKFGIEVYKDKETPKSDRFLTVRMAIKVEETAIKTKLRDKFETAFNKWIEKIELK